MLSAGARAHPTPFVHCLRAMLGPGPFASGTQPMRRAGLWRGVAFCGSVCRRRCYQMAMTGMVLHVGKCKPLWCGVMWCGAGFRAGVGAGAPQVQVQVQVWVLCGSGCGVGGRVSALFTFPLLLTAPGAECDHLLCCDLLTLLTMSVEMKTSFDWQVQHPIAGTEFSTTLVTTCNPHPSNVASICWPWLQPRQLCNCHAS